jgi:hypothetical protein
MRRAVLVASRTVLLVLGTSSCLLATPPGDHVSAPVGIDDFCTRFAQSVCEGFDHCCDDPATRASAPDRATCIQALISSCTDPSMISIYTAVSDPVTGYDPVLGGAMFGMYNDYIERCDPNIVLWSNRRDGFEAPLVGTRPDGEQCLDGSALDRANFTAFLSCEGYDQACILNDLSHGFCHARRHQGDTCSLDFDCVDGLYCPAGLGATCQPRLPNGGACGSLDGTQHHAWCASSFCYAGMCETPTRTHVYCGDYNPAP